MGHDDDRIFLENDYDKRIFHQESRFWLHVVVLSDPQTENEKDDDFGKMGNDRMTMIHQNHMGHW